MAKRRSKIVDSIVGGAAIGALGVIKRFDRKRSANLAGGFLRKIGPLLPEHRIGRANLRAAYPQKSDAEIETILSGVWDNLGRVAAEFAHLEEFHSDNAARLLQNIGLSDQTIERADRIRRNGKPVIGFAAHISNWEISALAVKAFGFESAVLYRRPNVGAVGDIIERLRVPLMGQLVKTGLDAPVKLARLLESGTSVGMLVDQHFSKGVDVLFFGRWCKANPLIAMIARQTECPIHGLRSVRLPDGNSFWGEITDEVAPVRDNDGRIEIKGTMQAITSVVESWVREHPEQWLWLHRRWR
jgi:Kdo2-lipid IVA lauroyltransferase/acyltransferase